jgi:hypothetical protein
MEHDLADIVDRIEAGTADEQDRSIYMAELIAEAYGASWMDASTFADWLRAVADDVEAGEFDVEVGLN